MRQISRALIALPPRRVRGPSLSDGDAGLAIAHAALDPIFPRSGHRVRVDRVLDRAIDGLARTDMSPALFGGFTGVAWAVEHLRGNSGDDANEAIDDALLLYVDRTPWLDSYDLIRGLTGIGVYALERLPRAGGRRILELVVERLAETARRRRPGLSWWSDPAWVPPQFRREPHLAWNLGVGHGVPAVIALLGGACRAGIAVRTARRLLDGAVRWLLAQELPGRVDAGFAYAVGPRLPREPARSAWCYGDPGVAATLLVAACAMGERSWKDHAVRIGLRAALRPPDECRVVDAGLCHGAAGLGHLYHRMYLMTGEASFARAARSWFVRALGFRQNRVGIAGFASWEPDRRGRMGWHTDVGLLTGVAGVALALASALSDEDPAWDRVLLLSVRSPPTHPAA
ncbi:MAG: lanthionine synthetase C family protein [Myxococcales bacterium]|nr:lanthionine synthetase C family protein [Myxococcales bacterium]